MHINILEYFITTVNAFPQKTAVVDGDRKISFAELERQAERIATIIIQSLKNKQGPIAVFLPKTIDCIISDLAIIYSGNAYMNLDTKSPAKRIRSILDQIDPAAVITSNDFIELFYEVEYSGKLINICTQNNVLTKFPGNYRWPFTALIDTDPLCIINTSGSTGTPKGVVLNHRSFIDFTECAIETLGITDDEIVGSLSPAVFDIYSFELCMLMAKGSTIVLLPEQMAAFPVKILSQLRDNEITFIFWVPTIMVNIANMDLLSKIALPTLKTIWFAGEVFPTKQFNYWRNHLAGTRFVNLYGPIEITLDCTYFIVDRDLDDDEPIPIGYPFRNTDVIILKEDNQVAAINEEGELCVRGTSLAMGYYNNPEKTSLAFVQNPLNKSYPETIYRTGDIVFKNQRGEIIFKGRKDSLIKHLGYRIELGEIEHVIINVLKLVENGCVVYNLRKKEITLFYEAAENIAITDFKKALGTIFPKYMIPSVLHRMSGLPRNINGKIDRLFLQQLANNDQG